MNMVMVFNATFSNIVAVSFIGVPGKNYRLIASQWQALSHNVA
jgi:hypothetical protein